MVILFRVLVTLHGVLNPPYTGNSQSGGYSLFLTVQNYWFVSTMNYMEPVPFNHVNKKFVTADLCVYHYPLIITCMFTSTGYRHAYRAFLTVNTVMLS